MTTYLLLALGDDGRVTLRAPSQRERSAIAASDVFGLDTRHVYEPVRTGTDRNAYSTYEVAGYSIDVRRTGA